MRIMIIGIGLLFIICFAGCGSHQTIDITPHVVNIEADFFSVTGYFEPMSMFIIGARSSFFLSVVARMPLRKASLFR
jgi:hypothetical protein